VFYLDHNYLENMLVMFKKVNAKERVVGFYSTGPQIRPNDLRIHDIVERFGSSTVFCIIDIRPDRQELPVTSYKVVEEVSSKSQIRRTFAHVPCQMGALEAEEVGVEHLLRDINDPTVSSLSSLISGKIAGLSTLTEKLHECQEYLEAAAAGTRPANPEIIDNLQTIVNLFPNLNAPDLVKALLVKTNDMYMAVYLASLIRAVLALHDLVNNKIRYGDHDGVPATATESDDAAKAAGSSDAASKEEKKEEAGDSKKKTKPS
jgi:26S proteasome regulatory subunit N8